jgi:hypothetical protein
MEKTIEALVKKAGEAKESFQALQFSQAACNAANALRVLIDARQLSKK